MPFSFLPLLLRHISCRLRLRLCSLPCEIIEYHPLVPVWIVEGLVPSFDFDSEFAVIEDTAAAEAILPSVSIDRFAAVLARRCLSMTMIAASAASSMHLRESRSFLTRNAIASRIFSSSSVEGPADIFFRVAYPVLRVVPPRPLDFLPAGRHGGGTGGT